MKSEADYKRIIRKSCEAGGGVAFMLEGLYQKGIPDMYIALPALWSTLAEVKIEKNCGLKFCRKIKYSKLQKDNMDKCWTANPTSALGLVVCEIDTDIALVALPPTSKYVKSSEMPAYVWLEGGTFDMVKLFKAYYRAFIVDEKEARRALTKELV